MIKTGQSVTAGNPTRALNMNDSYGTTDGLYDYSAVEHWFDPSTGTGKHKAINSEVYDVAAASIKDQLNWLWNPVSGTALDNQGMAFNVTMDNDAGEAIRFFRWEITSEDVSDGSEGTGWLMKGFVGGSETDILAFTAGGWDFQGLDISNIGNMSIGSGTWDDPWVFGGGLMYMWVHNLAGGNCWLMFKVGGAPVGGTQNAVKDDATGFFAQSDAPVPDA